MVVEIMRTELSASGLREGAVRATEARTLRRMLALAQVQQGESRTRATKNCGIDRQTLRESAHRCNAAGLAGLGYRRLPQRRPRLSDERMQELAPLVEMGPDSTTDGMMRAGGGSTSALTDVEVFLKGCNARPAFQNCFLICRHVSRSLATAQSFRI